MEWQRFVWFCSLGFFQVIVFKKLGLKVNSEIPGKTHSSFFFFYIWSQKQPVRPGSTSDRIRVCLQNVGRPKIKLVPKSLSLGYSTFVFVIFWDKHLKYLVNMHICYVVGVTH